MTDQRHDQNNNQANAQTKIQPRTMSRREWLHRSTAVSGLMSAQAALPAWMPRTSFRKDALPGDVLICIFLRGGADGLNIIVPHGDPDYYTARPNIGYRRPDDKRAAALEKAIDLDGFFGISYGGRDLAPLFANGQIAAIHAVGSPNLTRSHFDAMAYMERGSMPGGQAIYTGWLARHLESAAHPEQSFMRAVAFGDSLPQSLFGTMNAFSLQSITDYHLPGDPARVTEMLEVLNGLYNTTETPQITAQLQNAQEQVMMLNKLDISKYRPANGARYRNEYLFHLALKQTAALVKADVGLEVAAIDLGGWDTHQNENPELSDALYMLSTGLAALNTDMGERMKNITVIVMSEFGRRIEENGARGTEHGHGNMMMIMGGNVAKRPVVGEWPGLHQDQRVRGDLKITTDYRDVLAEILSVRVGNPRVDQVFPGYTPTFKGVVS